MRKAILTTVMAAAALTALAAGAMLLHGKAADQEAPPAANLRAADVRPKSSHPKLESSLAALFELDRAGKKKEALDYGSIRRMEFDGPAVRVVTEAVVEPLASTASVNARVAILTAKIASLGGRIETRHRHLIQHYVPVGNLEALASDPLVKFVRRPRKPFKMSVVSEGVSRTGADVWLNLTPYRAQGAGICILDLGFSGYRSLLGSELPSSVTTKSFRADGDLEADDHGAACAEIAYDMAPQSDFYLVNFDTDVEEHNALDWIVKQKIDVISYSIGWFNGGAGDGTGPICADVEQAAAADILWATSAGNGATDHWDGFFSDSDGDGWHNFAPSDEILDFTVPAYTTVGAFLNWKDFGLWDGYDYSGTDQDYDLYLYYWTGAAWQFIDNSANHQTGAGVWPTEEVFGWYAARNATWGMAIYRTRGTKNVRLELFAYNNSAPIEYVVPARSLVVPADSPDALSAGATDWSNDALHSYSSQGPTHSGIIKPDFTAPSGVSTSTFGTRNFYGTSASAPHLAGALALFRGLTPYSVSQVRKILQKRALDLGDPGRDNKYGYGRLNLKK